MSGQIGRDSHLSLFLALSLSLLVCSPLKRRERKSKQETKRKRLIMCGEWGRRNNMHQRKDWDGEGKRCYDETQKSRRWRLSRICFPSTISEIHSKSIKITYPLVPKKPVFQQSTQNNDGSVLYLYTKTCLHYFVHTQTHTAFSLCRYVSMSFTNSAFGTFFTFYCSARCCQFLSD